MMHKHEKTKRWFVTTVLGASMIVPAGARAARADDVADRAAADMDKLYNRQLAEIRDSNRTDAEKITAINALMASRNASMRTSGMSGRLNETTNRVNGNNTPGFWDKAGSAAIGIVGELLKAAITNWMNNPTKENEARIAMLEAERDRLMNDRNNPTNTDASGTNGSGRPIYDSNGNIIGWDRDGDGRADSTDANGDGRSDGFNGGSNENGYADPYEYLDGGRSGTTGGAADSTRTPIYDNNGKFLGYDTNGDGRPDSDLASNTPSGDVAGGGATPSGGGFGGGGGTSDGDEEDEDADKDKEDEDKEKTDEELAAADAKDGVKTGAGTGKTADGKRDRNGDGKDDELQMETIMTRVIIVPKVDPLAATGTGTAVGSARPGAAVAPAKPLEDNWNDTADNGDRSKAPDEWGDEWGEDWGGDGWSTTGGKPKPNANGAAGTGAATTGTTGGPTMTGAKPEDAQLVDELIRVETVVAEWRKFAKEEAQGKRDPYGFHDGAGYQGSDGMTQDPLAEFRGPDGKLDLTRVDVWLVDRDSWKEGMEPRRFKVTISEEAIDTFDPISGGYMMARGVVSEMKMDPRVIAEIKGSVKKFDLVQVVLSSETPPEDPANAPPTPGAVPAPSTAPSAPAPAGGDDW